MAPAERAACDGLELVDFAISTVAQILHEGGSWHVRPQPPLNRNFDGALYVSGPDDREKALLIIEAKQRQLSPTDAIKLADQLHKSLDMLGEHGVPIVVSPWLSPRTRQVLTERGIGFLDQTGNISLRIDTPAVFIKTEGEQRNPNPTIGAKRGISGERAGLVVRELVDFTPPRRAAELAHTTGISESYVSRLLDALREEALIYRSNHIITGINWPDLLRSRAKTYQVLKTNRVIPTIARRGANSSLHTLRSGQIRHQVLATGSLAAEYYSPLIVGGILQLYIPPGNENVVREVMEDLGLRTVPPGATPAIQLIQPSGTGPLLRTGPLVDDIPTVGVSQLALDCLSGPGRMPAAGEAVITWMQNHEDEWRRPSPLSGKQSSPAPKSKTRSHVANT